MVTKNIDTIIKELDGIDQDGRFQIIEYLIQGIKNDVKMPRSRYHFDDLAGKLKWVGDPVAEQKKIRGYGSFL